MSKTRQLTQPVRPLALYVAETRLPPYPRPKPDHDHTAAPGEPHADPEQGDDLDPLGPPPLPEQVPQQKVGARPEHEGHVTGQDGDPEPDLPEGARPGRPGPGDQPPQRPGDDRSE